MDNVLFSIAATGSLLGIASGAVGVQVVLRKDSQSVRAVSHAAFAGIITALLITATKDNMVLLLGGAVFALTAALYFVAIRPSKNRHTCIQFAICVYMGTALVLLSFANHYPWVAQAGIDKFLLGAAAAILLNKLHIFYTCGSILFILLLFWKDFTLAAFDPDFARASGQSIITLEALFAILLCCTIIIGIDAMGVLFSASLIVLPALAARQWAKSVGGMALLAMLFGGFGAAFGAFISSVFPTIPTGPAIGITLVFIVLFSFIFGIAKGLVWEFVPNSEIK